MYFLLLLFVSFLCQWSLFFTNESPERTNDFTGKSTQHTDDLI